MFRVLVDPDKGSRYIVEEETQRLIAIVGPKVTDHEAGLLAASPLMYASLLGTTRLTTEAILDIAEGRELLTRMS